MSAIWPAIAFSAFSATAFLAAIAWGFGLADVRSRQARNEGESRAALAAALGAIFLLVAVVFWTGYLIFGPVQDAVREIVGPGD